MTEAPDASTPIASIGIVGDGPGGLSAALFLAKAGHRVTVFGRDATAMNWAYLHNYLGIPEIAGTEFQQIAKAQIAAFGAQVVDDTVTAATQVGTGFRLELEEGEPVDVDFLILTEGKNAPIAESFGVLDDDGSPDRDGRTTVAGLYVVGRTARPKRSQAIISAGDGAAAALDILAELKGADVQDWDSPPKS